MIKILFLIHDLGAGGAEKVLVNLVNNMDSTKFEVHVIALFGGGVNEQHLASHVHYHYVWERAIHGNSRIMKIMSPTALHKICIHEEYDIEVAFLENVSSRIISGCANKNCKLYSWIHTEQREPLLGAGSFRNYEEAARCYQVFNQVVCVSQDVKKVFKSIFPQVNEPIVLYNTIETEKIKILANETTSEICQNNNEISIIGVGKISKRKGFDRLARIMLRLRREGFPVHFYALGTGVDQKEIEEFVKTNHMGEYYTFLGYQTNPYKYVSKCDLFVCASIAEGFSTATTEALVIGTPVCTVNVSGMKEMLGDNNEWGIVTENDENALFEGIKQLVSDKELLLSYKKRSLERGAKFSTQETVKAVEKLFLN